MKKRVKSISVAANYYHVIVCKILLDPGTPFLEFSQLAAFYMYKEKNDVDAAPSAGVITGIGSRCWAKNA